MLGVCRIAHRVAARQQQPLVPDRQPNAAAHHRDVLKDTCAVRRKSPRGARAWEHIPHDLDSSGAQLGRQQMAFDTGFRIDDYGLLAAPQDRDRAARRFAQQIRERAAESFGNPAPTRMVGLLRSRSTSESIARLTPLRLASASSESPASRRRVWTAWPMSIAKYRRAAARLPSHGQCRRPVQPTTRRNASTTAVDHRPARDAIRWRASHTENAPR